MRSIVLKKDHKQGDVQYYAGQTVTLEDDVANWLAGVEISDKVASRELLETEVTEETSV